MNWCFDEVFLLLSLKMYRYLGVEMFDVQKLVNEDKRCQALAAVALLAMAKLLKKVGIVVGIFTAIALSLSVLRHILPFGEYEQLDRRLMLAMSLTLYTICYIKREPLKAYCKLKYVALKHKCGL